MSEQDDKAGRTLALDLSDLEAEDKAPPRRSGVRPKGAPGRQLEEPRPISGGGGGTLAIDISDHPQSLDSRPGASRAAKTSRPPQREVEDETLENLPPSGGRTLALDLGSIRREQATPELERTVAMEAPLEATVAVAALDPNVMDEPRTRGADSNDTGLTTDWDGELAWRYGPLEDVVTIDQQVVTLGSGADNDIIIAQLNPRHFELRRLAECYELVEIDGGGAMTVNGEPTSRCALRGGDAIGTGALTIYYTVMAGEPRPAPTVQESEPAPRPKRPGPRSTGGNALWLWGFLPVAVIAFAGGLFLWLQPAPPPPSLPSGDGKTALLEDAQGLLKTDIVRAHQLLASLRIAFPRDPAVEALDDRLRGLVDKEDAPGLTVRFEPALANAGEAVIVSVELLHPAANVRARWRGEAVEMRHHQGGRYQGRLLVPPNLPAAGYAVWLEIIDPQDHRLQVARTLQVR